MSVTSIAKKTANVQHPSMVSDTGATYSVETIGPDTAKEMLASNIDNRHIRRAVVDRYARDMKAHKWVENGAAISFAADGTLLDGQHRLAAIVRAGVAVRLLVVRGLPNSAQDSMDDLAKRTLADTFNFHGISNANSAAAIVRRVLLWQNDARTNTGKYQPTKAEALAAIREDQTLAVAINAAAQMRKRSIVSPSIIGLTWWLFWNIDQDDCEKFWSGLHSGADLSENSPIFIVREQISRYNARAERVPETAYLAWVIKAWNHYRADKTLRPSYKYTIKSSEHMPEPK